ncbi:hypothetical protein AMTR_s00001p00272460 [Amborella trichopoda]|uniref:Uncharacterized protein n=1 Tax=Amborella trichopoda TaxID=13333 RepID=W1NME4_AMBTC|nr:hypothetical protein AMTR_s00001p00272460 [Amborella trichopoda]
MEETRGKAEEQGIKHKKQAAMARMNAVFLAQHLDVQRDWPDEMRRPFCSRPEDTPVEEAQQRQRTSPLLI